MKTVYHRAIFSSVFFSMIGFATLSAAPSSVTEIPFFKLYKPGESQNLMNSWKVEDAGLKMQFRQFEGIATLQSEKNGRPWGAVYQTAALNIDQYPILQIHVLSATKYWYLILSGPQFSGGYIRLTETKETGLFNFDIPKLTGLSGNQKFDVKIGVSDPTGEPLTDEKVTFDRFLFLSRETLP